jgi:hypothetical protein
MRHTHPSSDERCWPKATASRSRPCAPPQCSGIISLSRLVPFCFSSLTAPIRRARSFGFIANSGKSAGSSLPRLFQFKADHVIDGGSESLVNAGRLIATDARVKFVRSC